MVSLKDYEGQEWEDHYVLCVRTLLLNYCQLPSVSFAKCSCFNAGATIPFAKFPFFGFHNSGIDPNQHGFTCLT